MSDPFSICRASSEKLRDTNLSKEVIDACNQAYIAWFKGRAAVEIHNGEALLWQDRANEVFLWVTVIVVISGLALSAYQLWHSLKTFDLFFDSALRRARLAEPGRAVGECIPNDLVAAARTDTTAEVGPTGLKITSAVVGLAILTLSLAFFYLMVTEVLKVRVTIVTTTSQSSGSTPAEPAGSGERR